ncbi:MAG TPA: signal recognition particle-docking protein FtsY [Candidatus Cloacimonadota bacterium]|nr:signal recognition particle-docking protein FtsY [Candidatus Cloacimonadota bacterium]
MMVNIVHNLRKKIARTRNSFVGKLAEAIRLRGKIDEELMEELENILFQADTGVEMTGLIIEQLKDEIRVHKYTEAEQVQQVLQQIMSDILLKDYPETADFFNDIKSKPYVILCLGVNGVGKTTTIGKIAARFRDLGKTVLVIAGDTFRAAAIEQLEIWAKRARALIVKSQQGGDPSAVVFDGIQSAVAKGIDVVLIDTAGRQHTKINLMQELSKIVRTIKKVIPDAPQETLLVLDATTGQNAISQAKTFNEVANLTGLVLTKLDSTAKGGIIFNIKHELGIPVKLIGVGEQIEDLQPFDASAFVEAIFSNELTSDLD